MRKVNLFLLTFILSLVLSQLIAIDISLASSKSGIELSEHEPFMWNRDIPEPTKKIAVEHWRATDPVFEEIINREIAAFEKDHPNVKVVYNTFPGEEYTRKLSLAVAGGSAPLIAEADSSYIPQYADLGLAISMNDYANPDYIEDLIPGAYGSVVWKDNIYGFPNEATNLEFIYNKDIFKDAGLNPPKTYNEFIEAGQKLTLRDEEEKVTQWGFMRASGVDGWSMHVTWQFLWANRATILNESGTEPAVTTPELIKAVQDISDIYNKYQIAPLATVDVSAFSFEASNVAMTQQGCWMTGYLRNQYPDLNYGVISFPLPEGGDPFNGVYGGWISFATRQFNAADEDSKNATLLWLAYYGSGKSTLTFFRDYGTLPPKQSTYTDLIDFSTLSEQEQAFLELMKTNTRARMNHPRYLDITTALMNGIQNVIYKGIDAATAMQNTDAEIRGILEEYEESK